MGWFSKIFSSGVDKIVGSVGSIIDNVHTSDEEKEQLKKEIQALLYKHKENVLDHASEFEKEVTERHSSDMRSDSWLSKNIRPLALAFLTATTVLLVYATIFVELSTAQQATLETWEPLLKTLLTTGYVFYFGSRGFEKVQKIRRG